MGGFDLLAVIVFFLIGYWLVDFLWPKKKPPDVPNVPNVPKGPGDRDP